MKSEKYTIAFYCVKNGQFNSGVLGNALSHVCTASKHTAHRKYLLMLVAGTYGEMLKQFKSCLVLHRDNNPNQELQSL
jgi:hypothetical protein